MSSTHTSLHYHIVFSTKERRALISLDWRSRLHAYVGGTVARLGGVAVEVGGTRDHVHLLAGLRATHRLSDVVREVKSSSSAWIRTELRSQLFSWQDGYGGFTVSREGIDTIVDYLKNQDDHHHTMTFQEEYLALLEHAGVEYDERYLW